jgi:hypothetical protein
VKFSGESSKFNDLITYGDELFWLSAYFEVDIRVIDYLKG